MVNGRFFFFANVRYSLGQLKKLYDPAVSYFFQEAERPVSLHVHGKFKGVFKRHESEEKLIRKKKKSKNISASTLSSVRLSSCQWKVRRFDKERS